jgi:hypothetical protein
LNVLVPGLAMSHMSGGPKTAINLAYRLASLGVRVRFISTVRFVDILSTADVGCELDGQRYALPTSPQPPQPG